MKSTEIKELKTQHFEHKVWENELNFYADEIKIYEHQLEELVGKHIKEMLPPLERFQNNFIRQKEVIDELAHEIKIHEHELVQAATSQNGKANYTEHDHQAFQEKMDIFKKIYAELKNDFLVFWRKWH